VGHHATYRVLPTLALLSLPSYTDGKYTGYFKLGNIAKLHVRPVKR
jgi:hypothetical protein